MNKVIVIVNGEVRVNDDKAELVDLDASLTTFRGEDYEVTLTTTEEELNERLPSNCVEAMEMLNDLDLTEEQMTSVIATVNKLVEDLPDRQIER